jgi:CHRD domain-containing protein
MPGSLKILTVALLVVLASIGLGTAAPAPPNPPAAPAPSPSPTTSPMPSPGSPSPAPSPATPGAVPAAGAATVATVAITLAQEVPAPRAETPRTAAGMGAVVLNAARTEVGFAFTYSGMSGAVAQAHFHRGATGEAGPVVQTICGEPGPALSGACPSGNSGTVAGVWRIPQAMLADWQAGRIYVNFHTAMNAGGEIRGQIGSR